jgi:secreted PhoX family phosphatase
LLIDKAVALGDRYTKTLGYARTREVSRFLVAPRGAEVAGVSATPDGDTLFVNIQHPGRRTRAWDMPRAADPRAVSSWPDGDAAPCPRSATVAVQSA